MKNIKKFFSLFLAVIMLFSMAAPTSAFANEMNAYPDWEDIEFSEEEFNEILAQNSNNGITPYASGLIISWSIGISKSEGRLTIAGTTYCTSSVVKCGFSKVVIQSKKSSESTWSTYKTYTDLYDDSFAYSLGKIASVPVGYQYRVVCTHYAKKNLLSTQKIENTSNIITF